MKKYTTIFATVILCTACAIPTGSDEYHGRSSTKSELHNRIVELDDRLFGLGFNACNLQSLSDVTADDFEFYHDQAGTNGSKESFVTSIDTYVCNNEYRAQRRLRPETMAVFPLYRGDELYGAIQTASHEFFALYPDGREQLTDTARLFTLWIKTENGWKMRRSFSYDHVSYE